MENKIVYTPGDKPIIIIDELVSLCRVKRVNPYFVSELFVPLYKGWRSDDSFPVIDYKETADGLNMNVVPLNDIHWVEVRLPYSTDNKEKLCLQSFVDEYIEDMENGNVHRYDFGFGEYRIFGDNNKLIAYGMKY